MKLKDRVAVVTGAGSGIGRAIAMLFAEEGATVVANDISREPAEKTAAELGGRGRPGVADVSDSAQVRAMFERVDGEFGRLDILVNNAGIAEAAESDRESVMARGQARLMEMTSGEGIRTHWDITQSMSDQAWRQMLGVHLDGTFYCTREALRVMARVNRGAIVNIASVAGLMGMAVAPHYGAAKAGILGLTRSVAREVASRGIRVNAICPGWIDTPMTQSLPQALKRITAAEVPLQRWAEPREVATTALFLASDDSSYFTGQWLSPNGGLFMA